MTELIDLAIDERNLTACELRAVVHELETGNDFYPVTGIQRLGLILRKTMLTRDIKYWDSMIIGILANAPLPEGLNF
jgi:hypothetical protein